MPKKNKSKRFDKKGSHRFVVMHRSHLDPLYDVPGASKMVLQPATDKLETEEFLEDLQTKLDEEAQEQYTLMKEAAKAAEEGDAENGSVLLKKIDTQMLDIVNEYGLPNDGYDYSQHTKEMGQGTFVAADGSVMNASAVATAPAKGTEGLASEVATMAVSSFTASKEEHARQYDSVALSTRDMADDVADALDGGEGFEELADDFFDLAAAEPETSDEVVFDFDAHVKRLMRHADGIYSDEEGNGEDEEDEEIEFDPEEFMKEQQQNMEIGGEGAQAQHFPAGEFRPERDVDSQFDMFMADEYDDADLGDLEEQLAVEGFAEQEKGVVIKEGTLFDVIMDSYLEEEAMQRQPRDLGAGTGDDEIVEIDEDGDVRTKGMKATDIAIILNAVEQQQDEEGNAEELQKAVKKMKMRGKNEVHLEDNWANPVPALPRRMREKWDVESITSTYSNLDNHPTVLKDPSLKKWKGGKREPTIKISNKTGMPIVMEEAGEEEKSEEEEECEAVNLGVARPKKETKAERKARKQAVKEARRARRQDKKGLKNVYKEEEVRQLKAGVGGPTPSVYKIK